jgi:hypothetical protein
MNFEYLPFYDIADDDETDYVVEDFHEFYLFIWCVLTNRLEMAKVFWRLGNVCFLLYLFVIQNEPSTIFF